MEKVRPKDLELEPDPVWVVEDNMIKPSPFFLKWWQRVAEQHFGQKGRWLDIAIELDYVGPVYDPEAEKTYLEPLGFDYDPALARSSLGIPNNMPLVTQAGNLEAYQQLWDWLLKEEKDGE